MLLVLCFSLVVLGATGKDICEKHPNSFCNTDFVADIEQLETVLPEEPFFDKHCEGLLSFIDCLSNWQRECRDPEDDSPFSMKLSDARQVVNNLCDKESPLGKVYRENIDCINGLRKEFDEAISKTKDFENQFRDYLREEGIEFQNHPIKIRCAVVRKMKAEFSSVLDTHCGSEAKEAADGIMEMYRRDCSRLEDPEFEEYLLKFTTLSALEE